MRKKKKSLFERLTGGIKVDHYDDYDENNEIDIDYDDDYNSCINITP